MVEITFTYDFVPSMDGKAYAKLASFRGRSSFKTWLTRLAYNEGVSWLRANRRHAEGRRPLDDALPLAETGEGQEAKLLESEKRKTLLRGLEQLSGRYRTALVLRYFHGLPVREIAAVLGCSEGTAKNALFRGVRRLRSRLAES